jgi:hypothetical protein
LMSLPIIRQSSRLRVFNQSLTGSAPLSARKNLAGSLFNLYALSYCTLYGTSMSAFKSAATTHPPMKRILNALPLLTALPKALRSRPPSSPTAVGSAIAAAPLGNSGRYPNATTETPAPWPGGLSSWRWGSPAPTRRSWSRSRG